jgi:GH18 family chitinase
VQCKEEEPLLEEELDYPSLFIAGYLPYWGMPNFDRNSLNHLDRVYYFSLAPDADGQFVAPERDIQNLRVLSGRRESTSCELFVVLGGWYESETIHGMAANAEKRRAYIEALVDFCQTHQLEGVDLDWENYPYPFDKDDFVTLVNDLSYALKNAGLGFSIALDVSHYDLATQIVDQVDVINLMSYGILDNAGNHATLNQMVAWLRPYKENQILSDKIIVGVPFYGKRPYDEDDNSPRAVSYRYIVEQSYPLPDVNKFQKYSFNGRNMLTDKVTYLRKHSYHGIMSWELTQDVQYASELSLLKSIVLANQ